MGKKTEDREDEYDKAWLEDESDPLSAAVRAARARAKAGRDEDYVAAHRELDDGSDSNFKRSKTR